MAEVPDDRRYLASHEWALKEPDGILVGITSFASQELGELVFIDLPKVGTEVEAGQSFGEIESVKAVSELNAPVGGKVIAINRDLESNLETIGESPYDEGWMIKIDPSDDSEYEELLDAAGYQSQLESDD